MASDIVVLGNHGCGANEVRVHHIPVLGETITAWDHHFLKDGGKGSHQAIVVSRLGGRSVFIGKVGKDQASENAKNWLVDDNVNIDYLLYSDEIESHPGFHMVDDNGGNSIVSIKGKPNFLTFEEVSPHIKALKGSKIFITGFEIPVRTALRGAKLAKELGMFTILNPGPTPDEAMGELDYIDIIVPNEPEAKSIAGLDLHSDYDPLEMSMTIRDKYHVGTVVITLGGAGVFGYDGKNSWRVAPVPVKAVDTTGAGDAFIGGLALSLCQGKPLREAMEWGNYVAAFSVTQKGTIATFPTLSELQNFIQLYPKNENKR